MIRKARAISIYLLLVLSFCYSFAQNKVQSVQPTLRLGNPNISINQNFSISVEVDYTRNVSEPVFPELPGFQQNGVQQSTKSSHTIINGKMSSSMKIVYTCYYAPEKEGTYNISDAKLQFNGVVYNIETFSVKVGAARQANRRRSLFDDFFNDPFMGRSQPQRQYDYDDVSSDGQLVINTDVNEVYKGAPIHMEVDFIIPLEKQQFAQPTRQNLQKIQEFMMAQRPDNCWEEVIEFKEVISEITIKGKKYKKYKLFEAVYYPVNSEDVVFKEVSIDMNAITKVSKQTDFWGQRKGQTEKTRFKARAKTIRVKPLPAHPLKDVVSVGNYVLKDKIDSTKCHTGSALQYEFRIEGEGNINSITKPNFLTNEELEVLDPESSISIYRKHGRVFGNKKFKFYMLPQEPGEIALADNINWVYFNYKKEEYDTLRSDLMLEVIGESQQNKMIAKKGFGAFYDLINTADNTLESRDKFDILQLSTNVLGGLVLCCSVGLFIYRRRKDKDG